METRWRGSSKPYIAGRLRVTVVESLDWTIVEVTLGPDSQRPVHGPWALSVVRGHKRTRPMTSTSPVEESRGKAYIVGQWEAGTQAEI